MDTGRLPTTGEGLESLVKQPVGLKNWPGPYLKKDIPPDPWGRRYIYVAPGKHGDFDLASLGRDGQLGGQGDDADVVNW